jgi:5-aminolevulinate synthase
MCPKVTDVSRQIAPQTTSLPPASVAGARAAIDYQKKHLEDRQGQHINVAKVKADLAAIGLPVIPNTTHIIPVVSYDSICCSFGFELTQRFI